MMRFGNLSIDMNDLDQVHDFVGAQTESGGSHTIGKSRRPPGNISNEEWATN